jgi:hypothetical protein
MFQIESRLTVSRRAQASGSSGASRESDGLSKSLPRFCRFGSWAVVFRAAADAVRDRTEIHAGPIMPFMWFAVKRPALLLATIALWYSVSPRCLVAQGGAERMLATNYQRQECTDARRK